MMHGYKICAFLGLCAQILGQNISPQNPAAFAALDVLRGRGPYNAAEVLNLVLNAVPGTTYPNMVQLPQNIQFSCSSVPGPGYYANIQSGCQVFHRCEPNNPLYTYLCPVSTLFNQITLTCDYWYNVCCQLSQQFFTYSNPRIYAGASAIFLDTGSGSGGGMTTGGAGSSRGTATGGGCPGQMISTAMSPLGALTGPPAPTSPPPFLPSGYGAPSPSLNTGFGNPPQPQSSSGYRSLSVRRLNPDQPWSNFGQNEFQPASSEVQNSFVENDDSYQMPPKFDVPHESLLNTRGNLQSTFQGHAIAQPQQMSSKSYSGDYRPFSVKRLNPKQEPYAAVQNGIQTLPSEVYAEEKDDDDQEDAAPSSASDKIFQFANSYVPLAASGSNIPVQQSIGLRTLREGYRSFPVGSLNPNNTSYILNQNWFQSSPSEIRSSLTESVDGNEEATGSLGYDHQYQQLVNSSDILWD